MGDAKIKAFIDRVLISRAREDAEKANTREIYKELAGEGYDKTVVGKVVNHLRKDAAKERERSELFDLYLSAYLGPSHVHARVREELPAHDPSTGEIIEDTAETPNEAAHTSHVGVARQAEEEVRASSAANSEPQPVVTDQNAEANAALASTDQRTTDAEVTTPDANTHGQTGTADPGGLVASDPASAKAVAKKVGQSGQIAAVELPVDANSEPQPTAAQTGGAQALLPTSVAGPEAVESPVINSNVSAPRPEGCERPHACGSSSWRKRCFTCQRAWDAAHGQSAGDAA